MLSNVTVPAAETCPGLFCPIAAQDGILARIRVPGGRLNASQCVAIANLADRFGNGLVQVTNRANLQLRGLETALPAEVLQHLQAVALAASMPAVDAIRNIMASPTAGIDAQAYFDTRPLVNAWNNTLSHRPDFAVLSPKFSVCFEGGEAVGVGDRPNDIALVATKTKGQIWLRLRLSLGDRGTAPQDVGVAVKEREAIPLLTGLAEVYRDYILEQSCAHKPPRLRALLQDWGVARYLKTVSQRIGVCLRADPDTSSSVYRSPYAHLGLHPQRQTGLSYLGISLLLGQLNPLHLRALSALSVRYGDGNLHLTPWQTLVMPNLLTAQVERLQQHIEALGLQTCATHASSAMIACSGTTGCRASLTDTQRHAQDLAAHLSRCVVLDNPINIHLSGCKKSCAQHRAGDITLVGTLVPGGEAYHIYVGREGSQFGQKLGFDCTADTLPQRIEAMVHVYQRQRLGMQESFRDFVGRTAIADLQQLFAAAVGQP